MIERDLGVKWSASGRVNLVNDNLLKKMHKAGCVELSYGFESGNQKILDGMKKRVTVKQAEEAIKMTRRAKISVIGSFMFGMPGEIRGTINETLQFIKRNRLPIHRFFYATPYPGTELYEVARKMGRLPENEDKYVERLGEMRTTFLVNLTDFTDEELVRLKNSAEVAARRNLNFKLRLGEFTEDWQRRFIVIKQGFREAGIFKTLKIVISKIWSRVCGQDKKIF